MLEQFTTPFSIFIFCITFLAAINKSVGVRKLYVQLLLKIFEYGRQNIEKARKNTRRMKNGENSDDTENEADEDSKTEEISAKIEQNGTTRSDTLNDLQIGNGNTVISREALILLPDGDTKINSPDSQTIENPTKEGSVPKNDASQNQNEKEDEISFNLAKCLDYVKAGVEAIIEDDVTSRFEAEELKNWNLLTRTNRHYEFISWRLTVIWMCGFIVRYFILMPLRVFICFVGVIISVICNGLVSYIPNRKIRQFLAEAVYKLTFRLFTRSLSALITIHNEENKPKNCGFCVANHTSPIDVAILSTECTFSLIGQRHGGFLGVLQRALGRASPHIWFERAEAKDRHAVAQRLRDHVSDPKNPPILIFPEGTCINNTSVMQFKKGSFEVGGVIYPVAIKYDPRFGDAFWNSSKYSMMQYLYMMMTSWAIVCDVWYLPPMYRNEGESAIDFANRVKSVIAKQGGLVDLVWDGQLKRMKPKKEWKEKQQVEFTKRLKGE